MSEPTSNEISEAEGNLRDIFQRIDADKQAVIAQALELDALTNKVTDTQGKILELNDTVSNLQSDIDSLTAQKIALQSDIDSLTIKESELSNTLLDSEYNLEQTKVAYTQALSDTQSAQDKLINDANIAITRAQSQVSVLLDQKKQLDDEIATLNDIKNNLESSVIPVLSAQKDSFSSDILILQGKLDDMTAQLTDLGDKITQASDSAVASAQALEIASQTLDAKKAEIATVQGSLDALIAEMVVNDIKNTDFQKIRAAVMTQSDEYGQRMAYLRTKYTELGEPW